MVSIVEAKEASISVVIPTYNAEAFIGAALESVLSGSRLPAEIIVVDDHSSDDTVRIARSYGVRTIVQAENAGPSAARNAGVEAARSTWVAFLDADDTWFQDKLETQLSAIGRWPDLAFCFTDYNVVTPNGAVVLSCETLTDPGYQTLRPAERNGDAVRFEREDFVLGLVRSMFVRQSSLLVRRDLFLRCGGYNERYRIGEDYDFLIRLSAYGPAAAIERALVSYVRHDGSLSADPLDEIASIDTLWDDILANPGRYPSSAIPAIRDRRLATQFGGALLAMRLGRIAEARPFVMKALQLERSLKTIALYALWRALCNPFGRRAHHILRAAWRRRAGRIPAALSTAVAAGKSA